MEFKDGYYGIHGTNQPDSIGGYVSNGCVRMREEDVEQLFDAVEIGIPVEIRYERLVIEETDDGMSVYYIYPDGYCRQYLDVARVREELEPYGLNTFLSNEDILEKLKNPMGNPLILVVSIVCLSTIDGFPGVHWNEKGLSMSQLCPFRS